MFRTLQIEWMKVKNYRTFWILLLITIVCLPAFNYVIYDFTDSTFPKINGQPILGNPFSFPDVWQTVSYLASVMLFIPAVLIITLTTNEFTYRTHRQNVIDGWSRSRFINIKILEVFLLSALLTLVVYITAYIFGSFASNGGQVARRIADIRFIFFFFVQAVSYSMIAFVLGMLIRRAGLAMGVFFIYMIIEQTVVGFGRNKYKVKWVNYLPQETTDMLIPQPFGKQLLDTASSKDWEAHIPMYLGMSALYLLIYIVISNWRFRKTDL